MTITLRFSLGDMKGMSNHSVGKDSMSHGFQRNFISPKKSVLNTQRKKKDDLLKGGRPLFYLSALQPEE